MSTDTKGKALIEQTVTVEFAVTIEASEADLTMSLDELRERIESHVRGFLKAASVDQPVASLYAQRGPSGYRFFGPESLAAGYGPTVRSDVTPLSLSLTDLGYKEN